MTAVEATVPVPRMKLGSQGLEVSAQGLGCMGMSMAYGERKPEADKIALLHHAIASGVTFLDTSDKMGSGTRELGIGIVAYSPLGRGFFTSGAKLVSELPDNDFRKNLPRFQPENMKKNALIFERVSDMAARKGCTTSQLALAWVHHQGSDVCPIPGTTKIANFNQNLGALSVKLTPEEMAELESYASIDNVQGDRCHSTFLNTWKDSETPPLSSWKGN
ncbi:unnamed protein product [Urochloa decumbens]|uniref:NADP-dependent oxidoreductase domain-containing protein n=1 Tax=Urochloa decumbens TaxID=240449 RepID=A0ABC9D7Q0_9POAL